MAAQRRQYVVNRPVYSEDSFTEEHHKISRGHKTIRNHVGDFLTCDSKRATKAALTFLPVIGWMRNYKVKKWLLGDLVSGISTGLVAIMQGLAFALLAELPPIYGLYTAFFPMLTYFIFGTSRHISVGSFPVLSLMIGAVVLRLVPENAPSADFHVFQNLNKTEQKVIVASTVTFLMGIYQLGMGLLQVGFIVVYLSDTLVSGFTTSAAIHILVSQLKFVFGLSVDGQSGILSLIYTLEIIFNKITKTNICDLVMSILIMLVVFIVKELNEMYKTKLPVPIPIEAIMTVIACGVSYGFDFKNRFGITVVGKMVSGYDTPIAPSVEVMQESALEAFPIAIVGFAVAFSVAKVYSIKHNYNIDGNQELVAFGISNMFGACFRSFAASTSLSRTAVQESSGGKTQIAGLISAMVAMIVTVALGFLLEPLPTSVLGALVIVNLKGMLMQFREICYLWRRDKLELLVWIGTCLASTLLGLDLGLAVGLGIELITVILRTQFPRCCILANIPGTDIYRDRKDYFNMSEPKGVKIFRIPSPIFFANIEFFRNKLVEAVGFNPLKVFNKRNKALRKLNNPMQQLASEHAMSSFENQISTISYDNSTNKEELNKSEGDREHQVHIDWIVELPEGINVPRVDIHSLILDFSAVSFLDVSALKGLKMALKEFIQINVDVYIVSCDVYILEKLHSCMFFDEKIQTSICFPTLHDAVLHVSEKHPEDGKKDQVISNTKL